MGAGPSDIERPIAKPTAIVSSGTAADGVAFVIDLQSGEAQAMEEISLSALGLKEREDLQRWITAHPEIVGDGLLLITTEFDRWAIREQKVADRLDVLLLDPTGSPVVAELKRDKATDTVELQALKYGAYCSQLTLDDLAEEYARYHNVQPDEARAHLIDHAPDLEEHEPGQVRIRLVAGGFGPAVTSVVLWLREYGIDIGCIELTARRTSQHTAVLSARQLLPLPQAEDYLVRRRRKEQEQEEQRRRGTDWTWEMYEQTFPTERVQVARELFRRIEEYIDQYALPWTPVLRSSWLGFKRPGGFYVPVLDLYRDKPVQFAVKVPADPVVLGLTNPYPQLAERWDPDNRQWRWDIPSLEAVPDVATAIELSMRYQPVSGPMPRIDAEGAETHAPGEALITAPDPVAE